MTDTITIRTYAPGTDTPHLLETRTEEVPIPPDVIEERAYTSGLAAEFVDFKTALDALTAASGTSKELKQFARATRRMFRAAIRELADIDPGT